MTDIRAMTVLDLQAESARIESSIGPLESQLADLRSDLQMIRGEIAKRLRPATEPRLSDHALLRYLERVKCVDVEAARAEIMTPGTIAGIKAGAAFVIVSGVRMVVKDNCIVTITDKRVQPRLRQADHRRPVDDDEMWRVR